jgi:hypothetical protein
VDDAGMLVGDTPGQGREGNTGLEVTSVLQDRKELSAQFLKVYFNKQNEIYCCKKGTRNKFLTFLWEKF